MNPRDLVSVLKEVPPLKLRLSELAWEITREDGSLDYERLSFYQKELREATSEAEALSRETREMVRCLRETARSNF